ncbi:hypothetical protein DFR70_10659 [Nocardia tenerifensis]|uniref:Uncharacterized protein n=1 Tax=Nocardia tenerifensis TaxID=228006 RepID=A0A318K1U3_9NOCA|nr:hypothetical protein [Nocardia tenerifensis]PXX63006.1 hypothetical protein DFR70_10659 [Nocardia tenerifensis]
MPPSPSTGHLRGGLVGVLVGALAVAAHGVAGGGFPDSAELTPVLLVAALAGCAASTFAGGRASVLGLLMAGQLASHVALSGLLGHEHPTAATSPLPTGGMLVAHAVASLGGAAIISVAERLYALASGAVRAVLARPSAPRVAGPARWSNPGVPHYLCPPNGAIGPRAPPVPA